MNIALWIIQIIVGIKLVTVSITHGLRQSQPAMQEAVQKMGKVSRPLLYGISISTFLATCGLILPGILRLAAWIVPASAVFSAAMLLVSIFFHIRCREKPNIFVGIILFLLAACIACGRWTLAPL